MEREKGGPGLLCRNGLTRTQSELAHTFPIPVWAAHSSLLSVYTRSHLSYTSLDQPASTIPLARSVYLGCGQARLAGFEPAVVTQSSERRDWPPQLGEAELLTTLTAAASTGPRRPARSRATRRPVHY